MKNLKLNISTYWQLVILFTLVKLTIHFITNTNYELHRDAYLYYAQSEHLAWGYHAVPPFIAIIGKLSTLIFGNTVFGLRFFPALIGGMNIVVIGAMIKELGGKTLALSLASLALILSPVFLHVNTLFQPVAFNQFFWLLSAHLILLLINRSEPKMWLWIGLIFGIAFLNKYSIAFFILAFAISLAVSKHRNLYYSNYFLYAVALGLIIILPNLIWQVQNNFPVAMHMRELRETQLIHVNLGDFFKDQFLMHVHAIWLWLAGLSILLFHKNERNFRLFAYLFLLAIGLIVWGSGKSYYAMGVYPILFVFGAFFIDKYLKKCRVVVSLFIVANMVVSLIISFNFDGIPFRSAEETYHEGRFTWENGKKYGLPQDMADMTGWKELAGNVIDVYKTLDIQEQDNCEIYCHHYGQAGSIMFFGKEYGLPQPACFNGSFAFWAPEEIHTKNVIIVVHEWESYQETEDDIDSLFESWELKAVVKNDFFRENGTRIYLANGPQKGFTAYYHNLRTDLINRYKN